MVGLILAGGSGDRFWPVSQESAPKQLLPLLHESRTMLEETMLRVAPLIEASRMYVSASASTAAAAVEKGIVPPQQLIVEPVKRSTLGAFLWSFASLAAIHQRSESETVVILAADHYVGEPKVFLETLRTAEGMAQSHRTMVTLGIGPNRPETGYGYIELGEALPGHTDAHRVERFVEKPDRRTASEYLVSGRYLWNSGMLITTGATFVGELERLLPDVFRLYIDIVAAMTAGELERASEIFEQVPSESIEKALFQKSDRMEVLRAYFPWDDVGTWTSVERLKGSAAAAASGECVLIDAPGCVVQNRLEGVPLAVIGLSNAVIVAAPDGILVCDAASAERVREVPQILRQREIADGSPAAENDG